MCGGRVLVQLRVFHFSGPLCLHAPANAVDSWKRLQLKPAPTGWVCTGGGWRVIR